MMDESPETSMEFLVTAADLRLAQEEVVTMLERLAHMFELALPEHATVKRGGWLFSKEKPVESLQLDFGDLGFELERQGKRHVVARTQKRVRGVVLKTSEVPLDEWTADVARELTQLATHNSRARKALGKLTEG